MQNKDRNPSSIMSKDYKYHLLIFFSFSFMFFLKCAPDETKKNTNSSILELLTKDYTKIDFANHVDESAQRGFTNYEYFYNGSGVAIGDINNDDLPDIFFTGSDALNHIYLNKGNLKFEDISKNAGIQTNKWSTGVTMVDINSDGHLDVYVCNSGPSSDPDQLKNELFINNGNNTFTEKAEAYGIADNSWSTHASFFDMDKDGDLDLWVLNHGQRRRGVGAEEWLSKSNALSPDAFARECNTLYRNNGNGTFTDVSKQAGIQKIGFGLGLAINDFDENGFLDVYVANDYFIPDFLYLNNGDGTFTDKIETKLSHTSYYAMGCDAADINNDGLIDLAVLDMTPSDHVRNKVLMASMDVETFNYLSFIKKYTPQYMFNTLSLNNGFGIMSDIALYAGVSQTDWSWAPLIADFDNDGLKDLMITNGYKKDTKNNDWQKELEKISKVKGDEYSAQDYYDHLKKADVNPVPNAIFRNTNGMQFEDMTARWNFDKPSFSNGAAYADLDLDGDLDLVINNFDQPAFIYKNNSDALANNNYLNVKLEATNSSHLHAKVKIYYNEGMQSVDYLRSRGFQSSVDPMAHFGLGQVETVDKLEVLWLDGQVSTISNPKINTTHTINKSTSEPFGTSKKKEVPYFANLSQSYVHPPFQHKENVFNDFQKEILLPHRQSMLGPAIAVGDINRDGTDDFYIGGAKGQIGGLYTQDGSGHFTKRQTSSFNANINYEETGAKFIDIDGDNDLDLYIANGGGGDFENDVNLLQDKIYTNDGKGNFTYDKSKLPNLQSSTKVIAPCDWDKDGDIDLFIGGRTTPGKYPVPPNSYLLVNEEGIYKDMTEELAPELRNIGMITGAEWTDTDQDGDMDLMLVGEWMPIILFKNTENGFLNKTEALGLNHTNGWWSNLYKTDIDADGDDDFIIGNIGLNNKFHPSPEKPLYVYANDFDKNQQLDIVLSKIYKGEKVPVRGKECSSEQMPFISDKFPTYEGFATASLEDIYTVDQLSNSLQYEVNNFASAILKNNGNESYELINLPKEAQIAPINGIVVEDFDKDGFMDIVVAGNLKQTEVETPMYDAGKGLYLKGSKSGEFQTTLKIEESGIFLPKDVKDIALIHIGPNKRPSFLVANNNDQMELIVYRR